MEFVSRIMDGSLPLDVGRGGPEESAFGGPKITRDQKIEYLQRVPLFHGCSQRQLRAVAAIASVLTEPAGAVLTRTGDPGNEFFLLVDGTARVEVSPEKQGRVGPGDFFGEMSLLDGEPRSATVVAETPIRVLVIERRHFTKLLSEIPQITHTLLATLTRRVRQAERKLNA